MPAAASALSLSRRFDRRADALVGREEFARMRLERHDGRRDAARPRRFDHSRQQRLMSAVHAVEVADRQCTWHAVDGAEFRG